MRGRAVLAIVLAMGLLLTAPGLSGAARRDVDRRLHRRIENVIPKGFVPDSVRARRPARYFVRLREPAVAQRVVVAEATGRTLSKQAQSHIRSEALASQASALAAARQAGGKVAFRFGTLLNGFSADLTAEAAASLAARPDVVSVRPVSRVRLDLESSVPFIGAPKVWHGRGFPGPGVRGEGMKVAVIDSGIDYTHADFGGPGTVEAFENNDPTVVEPGTFPTNKVIAGHDFVGDTYDPYDDDPANDVLQPDDDPLDAEEHGTHVAGICCGRGVPGSVGRGVAPRAKLIALKVFGAAGSATGDVIAAAIERATDPNQDGSVDDHVDVINMSLGSDYGDPNTPDVIASERAARLGAMVVASAGNAGNQPAGGPPYIVGSPSIAPHAISVAASIDEFKALTVTAEGVTLPDGGMAVHQDWSAPITSDISGELVDARESDPPDDPSGVPTPEDRQLCDQTPAGNPFAGKIALVFKGSTGEGDCDGSTKVFRAQEAGAIAVILWSGFPGLPFGLGAGEFADQISIPAVMVSTQDGAALADAVSPGSPPEYNSSPINVTINSELTVFPDIFDWVTDFSSEGPARVTNELKPDITAPGADITSAGAGTGTGSLTISGTSMAAPHISGVAALLRQLHTNWSPDKIKALIMNHGKRKLKDAFGSGPISATIQGAGRVRADESAKARSLAWPGSISFGLHHATGSQTTLRSFRIQNYSSRTHEYRASVSLRYNDFAPGVTNVSVGLNRASFGSTRSFTLGAGERRRVWVRLRLNPSLISAPEQEFGWYFFHPNMDGVVRIHQSRGREDTLGVPWHVAPLAASRTSVAANSLDLSSGSADLPVNRSGAGVSHADAYLLGATDPVDQKHEEDITHIGARSFTGGSIDGEARKLPREVDPLGGIDWVTFLEADNRADEPVEFGVRASRIHNTTESVEVSVLIDAGADGVFADPDLKADYMAVKPAPGSTTCLFDLSLASPFEDCAAVYFPDYSNFNTNVFGIVVDAGAIGLTDAKPEVAYSVEACTIVYDLGTFEEPQVPICDSAGEIDSTTGTWGPRLNVIDPALKVRPLVCGGFWSDPCRRIHVAVGSAEAGSEPSLLVLFPNNRPSRTAKVVATTGI